MSDTQTLRCGGETAVVPGPGSLFATCSADDDEGDCGWRSSALRMMLETLSELHAAHLAWSSSDAGQPGSNGYTGDDTAYLGERT